MSEDNSAKLSGYGFKFQTKLISCLFSDAKYLGQIYDLLKVDYFESPAIKFIINKSLEYFKKYKKSPTLEVLKVEIDNINDELLRQEIITALRESYNNINSTDLEFIKETTLNFCKNQEIKQAILDSIPLLKQNDYESIKQLIDNAMKVGIDNDIGLYYFDNITERYEAQQRNAISTGFDIIDELLKGGLAAGELGVGIAPSGAGKSWFLAAIGANIVKSGKRVVHYSLELSEQYTAIRYDCILSGISLDKIRLHTDRVEEALKNIPGDLIIKWFPTKSVSLLGIRAHLMKLKIINKMPDVIIIDYADLLKYNNNMMAKHDMLEALYEELRGLAGELQLPIWTVSQSNREGLNDDIIEADKAAGAYAKIFPADFVFSLSRKAQDKLSNTARVHIIKNRFGVDGITFPVYMDTSAGIINIYNETSSRGKELQGKMTQDTEYNKNRLKQRIGQINSKKINENSANSSNITNLF